MFWIALAAQLAAPEPKAMWFSDQDTPVAQLSPDGKARLLVRVSTDENGSVVRCEVEESSGKPALDAYTCALTKKRARFKPARWMDGSPVHGAYRVPIVWTAGSVPSVAEGDLELTVNELPQTIRSPAVVRVMFAVDVRGKPSNCVVEPGNGVAKPNLALGSIACEELLKVYSAIPVKDAAGNIVSSVQDASVVFLVAPPTRR